MSQDRHVTSKAIRRLGDNMTHAVAPAFEPAKQAIQDATIDYPAFGPLGFMLDQAYEQLREYAVDYINAAQSELVTFQDKLHSVASTWEQAEDTNQVMFR